MKQMEADLQQQQKEMQAFVTKHKIRAVRQGEEEAGGSSSGSKPKPGKQPGGGSSSSKGVLA
jgi:hypothetical protein